jgi:hypothetical protein
MRRAAIRAERYNSAVFARRVFLISGLLGLVQIVPLFFLEPYLATRLPPPLNHPEWYYGFLGVTLPWQLAFLLISRDPARYRPLMPLAVLEKLGFVIPMTILFAMGRVHRDLLPGPALDAVWAVLFAIAWARTPREAARLPIVDS